MSEAIYVDALQRARSQQMEIGELIKCAEEVRGINPAAPLATVIELYKTWLAHNGENPFIHAIYFNYAVSLSEAGDLTGAVNALRETIRIKPEFCPPYINLGGLMERLGHTDKALSAWNDLLIQFSSVTPDAVSYKLTALKQMGRVLELSNNPAMAEGILLQSMEINQDQPDVMQHYIALRQGQCKWPVISGSDKVSKKRLMSAISPLSIACYTDDPMYHLACSYRYNRKSVGFPARKPGQEKLAAPTEISSGKLRIGYVSSDFRHHAVGFAMTDVFSCHDRKNFEIFGYYCGIKTTDITQDRIKQALDHWVDISEMNDDDAAARIRADKIDILIDLNGYTKDARTKLFSLRPTPIAVNWFGFPNTMGSPYHHYLIADDYVIPKTHEIFYSEKIVRLPCYQPNDRHRIISPHTPTRTQVGLPENGVVFCGLNGMQKITSRMFPRWMSILSQVPGSVLWLLTGTPETNQHLQAMAQQHGVSPDRLIFAQKMGNPEHLARYPLADLFLDTAPYGAHTTASDSMWMGVPILTMPGRSFAARVCADLVRAAGLPEMVASTPDEYVRMAVALGNDKAKLASLREKLLKGRETSLLFDTPLLVRHLEDLYRDMRRDFQKGKLPVPDLRNLEIYQEIAVEENLEEMELLSDEEYIDLYRRRLAEINDLYPIPEDNRLWNKKPVKL